MGPTCPILSPRGNPFTLLPIRDAEIFSFYKKHVASFWTVEEIDLATDIKDYNSKLTSEERHFIEMILAFFAGSDGIVNYNLSLRVCNEVQLPEARAFYSVQQMMETIHSETYSALIETLVGDTSRKAELFDAIQTIPAIERKAQWAMQWITGSDSFAERLIAFACVEGIFFSGSFCAIFWLKKRGLMPGLTFSNELISRDEALHRDFACLIHSRLSNAASESTVRRIVAEAVSIEQEFVSSSLPVSLIGMNSGLMCQYIEFVADHLLVTLGFSMMYKTANPFDFMELISMQGKTNFFEKRVGEYAKAGVMSSAAENHIFTISEDF